MRLQDLWTRLMRYTQVLIGSNRGLDRTGENMKDKIMYNRKTGQLGLKRHIGKKGQKDKNWGDGTEEWGSNYAVFILDPVLFTWDPRNRENSNTDWRELPQSDPRVQFMTLFHAIDSADWFFSGFEEDEAIVVEEAYIQNKHAVFKQIRDIFG